MNGTEYLLAACIALTISMALIPLLVRAAPRLGLLDMPDPRKVHAEPVPRVGGLAIVIGSLVAMLLWLPLDRLMESYFLAVAVLVALGIWDDAKEIGHYKKFTGQFIAVAIVVLYGDLHITRIPFSWEDVPAGFGIPFTIFAMVGMINAINHSDGLDGLAGGESLLSLVAIGYLASLAGGPDAVIIAAALVGGILGFLRFNTFPARIFMGDAGSQVLGLTLGFLAVLLTQRINPALSAAIPALLLGLPICDILAVFYLRIRHGMNWFRASKNHIHHRLLALGFAHHESVVVIYSVQALLVLLAVLLRYQTDALILSVYLGIVGAVFAGLIAAERLDWRADRLRERKAFFQALSAVKHDPRLSSGSLAVLRVLIPGYLILVNISAAGAPDDVALAAAVMLVVMLLDLLFGHRDASIIVRAGIYIAVVFTVYIGVAHAPEWLYGHESWTAVFFWVTAVAIAVNLRFSEREAFVLTPFDYLLVCAIIGVAVIGQDQLLSGDTTAAVVQAVILLYGCELLLSATRRRLTVLNIATLLSLGVICVIGVL